MVAEREGELLVAILGALEALPGRIADALAAGRPRTLPPSDADRYVLQSLVPAIAQAIGDLSFTAHDLIAQAQAADPELLEHLERALGAIAPGSPRRLGRLFARVGDALIGGAFALERTGASRAGTIWRIVRVSKLANSQERLRVAAAVGQDRGHA